MTPDEDARITAAIAQADSEHPPTPGSMHALRADLEDLVAQRDALAEQLREAAEENGRLQRLLDERWEYAKSVPGLIGQATAECAQENARLRDAMQRSIAAIHLSHARELGCMAGCGPLHTALLNR